MYNGWKNYETWNVALWIQNDPGLYGMAIDCGSFERFRDMADAGDMHTTPDHVAWDLPCIDRDAIKNMFKEILKNENHETN